MPWTFYSVILGQDRSVFRRWLAREAPVATRASLRSMMRHLVAQPRDKWREPQFKNVSGFNNIGEIRPNDWRLIGWFGPQAEWCFTVLEIVAKADGRKRFQEACHTAEERRKDILEGRRTIHEIARAEFQI